MGSVGEDDSQPSSINGNNCNLPKTLLEGCGASVPKKLRSAIKKRGRESITLPLPIPKKKHSTSNGVHTLGKDGTKKSKAKKMKGHITKDEEEVAETLNALAGMFADVKGAHQPGLDHEQTETKSSDVLEEGDLINAAEGEESRKTGSEVMIDAASPSSIADVVKSQSLGAQQPKAEPTTPSTAGFRSDLSLSSRPAVSLMAPLGEREIDLKQEGISEVQNGTYDKCNDKFLSPTLSATGAPSSETQKSCSRFPALFESTGFTSQPRVTENGITTEKVQYTPVSVQSKKSWKRCTAHVYISRQIKVMQISESNKTLPEKIHVNQIPILNGGKSGASSSGIQKDSSEIQNDILLHKRPVQEQQMATETSAFKQGYDFLSLGTGESVNKRDHSAIQYHAPYMQSQDRTAMLFPLPQNGHPSTFHTHNSALPTQQVHQYQSSFTAQTGQQLAAQLQTHYNNSTSGVRDSASVLNYAHALFPHLNAALTAKYQQLLPSQHQFLPLSHTLPLLPMRRHQHHLPLGFDRNPENIQQLQLHHLRNR